jgi:putative holliday junction resolvase
MRVLGIDYGQARMGIALSDEGGSIAMPLAVLDGTRDLKSRLGALVREHGVERIVMGNPLDRNGQPGEMSRKVEMLAERFTEWFGIKCDLWDERYTTTQASEAVRKSGGAKQKGRNDMVAATLILQSYLDSMHRCS